MVQNARAQSAQADVTFNASVGRALAKWEWPLTGRTSAVGETGAASVSLGREMCGGGGLAVAWFGHQWNALAKRDALGSVLTRPGTGPTWRVDDFFETGRADVDRLMAATGRLAPDLSTRHALDFGCGVGRLTQALAAHFGDVRGVDIAPSMIAIARHENRAPERCHFELNRRPHLRRFADNTFDLVYSRLVLQHMPVRLVRRYIPELIRVLAPGGLFVFQLPTEIDDPGRAFREAPVRGGPLKRGLPRWLVHTYRRVKYPLLRSVRTQMDMFGMSRDAVVEVVESCGARLLGVESDDSHGTSAPGFQYWATKPLST